MATRPSGHWYTHGPTPSRRRKPRIVSCANATHGPLALKDVDIAAIPEVQLRVGVRARDEAPVDRFTREIAPLILNGPPSVTGFAGGRPKTEEMVAYWPALIDKGMVEPCVEVVQV